MTNEVVMRVGDGGTVWPRTKFAKNTPMFVPNDCHCFSNIFLTICSDKRASSILLVLTLLKMSSGRALGSL